MKIDIYSHILPERYFTTLRKIDRTYHASVEERSPAVANLDLRLRLMDRHPDVLQVLSVVQPPLETVATPESAAALAKIANDELAELVVKYPDRFVAAVACLPMNDLDATLAEVDRAISQLGLKGVQIYSTVAGESLDNPKFRPLYEKMTEYDLPIWIHPLPLDESSSFWGLEVATSMAMEKLVCRGIFQDYPRLKFIVHHCGAMVPLLEGRIKWTSPPAAPGGVYNPSEHYRKFYVDTATYGSTGALMCGYSFFGVDRMLFATDAPMGPKWGITMESIKAVERMSIPDIEKEAIFRDNTVNLLRLTI